jgi:hypothetical protein
MNLKATCIIPLVGIMILYTVRYFCHLIQTLLKFCNLYIYGTILFGHIIKEKIKQLSDTVCNEENFAARNSEIWRHMSVGMHGVNFDGKEGDLIVISQTIFFLDHTLFTEMKQNGK